MEFLNIAKVGSDLNQLAGLEQTILALSTKSHFREVDLIEEGLFVKESDWILIAEAVSLY